MKSFEFNNNYAVVIGINQYENGIPSLKTAVNDAQAIAQLLQDKHKYKIIPEVLLNRAASHDRLMTLLEDELPKIVKKTDRLLFYFAGHGIALAGESGPDGYLVPQDAKPGDGASMYSMQVLHDSLDKLECRHLLLILDCCFAGAFRWSASYRDVGREQALYKEQYNYFLKQPAWQIITDEINQEFIQIVKKKLTKPSTVKLTDQEIKRVFKQGVEERVIRNVMLRMVSDIGTASLARRQVQRSELEYLSSDRIQVELVLESFEEARLLTADKDANDNAYIEPAHDALVVSWNKINEWLTEKQNVVESKKRSFSWRSLEIPRLKTKAVPSKTYSESEAPLKINLQLQRELTSAANHWWNEKENKGDSNAIGSLWTTDTRLPRLEEIQLSGDCWFNQKESDFVTRSIQRRRNNARRFSAAIVSVISVLMGATLISLDQLQQAQRQRVEELAATSQALLATQPVEATVNALAAVGLSRSLLVQFPDRLRFALAESSLLNAVQTDMERSRLLHTDEVSSVAISADGKTIVSGSDDGTIRFWNAQTRKPIGQPLKGHSEGVRSVAISADGKTIVSSGSGGGTVLLWNAQTQEPTSQPLKGHSGAVNSVAISADGKTIVTGGFDGVVRLWNAQTATGQSLIGGGEVINSVAISADGKTIVSAGNAGRGSTVRLWNAQTRKPIGQLLTGASNRVASVAINEDGKTIVSGGYDGTVRLWNAQTRKPIGQPLTGHSGAVNSVAISADGKTIVSGSDDGTIRLWNARTEEPIGQPLIGHSGAVNSVTFSADDKTIVSGGDDGTIRLWNAQARKLIGQPLTGHSEWVRSVAISADGKTIVSGGDDTVRLWNARTEEPTSQPLKGLSGSVAISADSKTIVSGGGPDGTVRLWNARTEEPTSQPLTGHSGNSVTISTDGKTIVSGSMDGTIRLWNAQTRKPIGQPLTGHSEWVLSVAISADGKTLVSGSRDGTVRVWDAQTRKPIGQPLTGHSQVLPPETADGSFLKFVGSVAISADGKTIVSSAGDGTVRLWNAQTREPIGQPLKGHSGAVDSVTFSADGKTIVSGGDDGTIRLWNARTGEPIGQPLKGHSGMVESVAISADGKTIVSGGTDKTVRRWAASPEQWLKIACEQLQYHSILTDSTTDVAKEARSACQKFGD